MKRGAPMKRTSFKRPDPQAGPKLALAKNPAAEPKPKKGPKPSKCAVKTCRAEFFKPQPFINFCSPECGAVLGIEKLAKQRAEKEKSDRTDRKQKLLAIEPMEYWLKRAEKACNAYIRKRDEGQGCISCGRHDAEVWNAGHFISVGANRTLRFHEDNIHLQCARPCNKDKGGNIHEYRKGLEKKIGPERLAFLDGWHGPVKMTIEKAQEIERHYKEKLTALKKIAP